MLTGPEQRKLRHIEQRLAAEDPRLARSLQEVDLTARRRGRWPYTLAVAGPSLLLLLICVVAALPVVGVLSAGAAALAIVVWIRRAPPRRGGTRPDPPR